MLAANRIDKVKGRIICLILSINTINGAKIRGAPSGTKCAALSLNLLVHPIKKKDNHNTNPNPKVIIGCAVPVKIKGTKPNRFINIMYKNVMTHKKFNPI